MQQIHRARGNSLKMTNDPHFSRLILLTPENYAEKCCHEAQIWKLGRYWLPSHNNSEFVPHFPPPLEILSEKKCVGCPVARSHDRHKDLNLCSLQCCLASSQTLSLFERRIFNRVRTGDATQLAIIQSFTSSRLSRDENNLSRHPRLIFPKCQKERMGMKKDPFFQLIALLSFKWRIAPSQRLRAQ